MKRFLKALLMTAIAPSFLWAGSAVTMDGPMTDASAAVGVSGATMTYTLNLDDHKIDYVSASVLVSSDALTAKTFNSGTASSATITVVTPTDLSTATATSTVYVSSYSALVNQTVFLAGTNFPVRVGTSNGATACNISDDIKTAAVFSSTCAFASASITVTAPNYGAYYNGYSIRSSSITAISSAAFSGGLDNAYLCVNGTCLYANKHWYPKATAALTADSLYAAINSSFSIVTSTDTGATAVIYATSTAVGTGTTYVLKSSTQAALTIGGAAPTVASDGSATGAMIGGTAASYALSGQTLAITSHGFPKGMGVYLSTAATIQDIYYSTATSGGTSTKLQIGSTFYVIPVTADSIRLALTSTGAVAGLPITFVSSATKTTTDTVTLNVPAIGGNVVWGWYMGNSGTNYFQYGSSTTLSTYVYPSSSTFVDLGNVNYKWLQLRVVPPATGAASVTAHIHGGTR